MKASVVRLWWLLPPILLATVLGLWRLDTESIWHDEAWSIRAIDSPWGTPDDNTPPLYYLTLHGLQRLGVGDSAFALRYGSVLIFLLVVAMGYRVARDWYGQLAATTAATLLALSPLLWEYAQEVRAYIAVPLLVLILLWGADRAIRGKKWAWQVLLVAELAALYTHNLAVLLVVWLNAVLILYWGWHNRQKLVRWCASQMAIGLLYLPWFLTQSPSGSSLNTVPVFGRELSQQIWRGYVFPTLVNPDDLPSEFVTYFHILPAIAALALVLMLMVWRRHLRAWLIFSQVLGLPILSTLLIQRASIDFHPRYYILAIPATMLLLVLGVMALPRWSRMVASVLMIGAVAWLSQQMLTYIADHPQYQHDDFRGLAAHYAELPQDAVVIVPYGDEPTLTHVFANDIDAEVVTLPLHLSPQAFIERINALLAERESLRLDALTWFQVPADERGMIPCLLGGAGQQVSAYETYGLSSTGYLLTQPISLTPLPMDRQFDAPVTLTHQAYTASEQGACIFTEWTGTGSNNEVAYKVALDLLDFTESWVLAESDSPLLSDDQRPIGEGASFSYVPLPAGLPAHTYPIVMRLYDDAQPTGYDVVANNQILGKDWRQAIALPVGALPDNPNAALIRDNTQNASLDAGRTLAVEIQFAEADTLRLVGQGWQLSEDITASQAGLWWAAFRIPPDAAGEATLQLGSQVLATYTIVPVERRFDAPDTALAIGQTFDPFATLVGITLNRQDNQLFVDVVWQATASADRNYVVFVQLLDANGQYLIGSDQQPANGNRPTSGWVADEYILDSHTINLDAVNYNHAASLLIGLYDPITGNRLGDAAQIALEDRP